MACALLVGDITARRGGAAMQLWTGVLSPFSAKVRIALAEKKLAYEPLQVSWSRTALWTKPPALLAVSPRGQVPVLLDDGVVVYDSTIIYEYLEDRYPTPSLLPSGAAARARCRLLEDEADLAMAQERHASTSAIASRSRTSPPSWSSPSPLTSASRPARSIPTSAVGWNACRPARRSPASSRPCWPRAAVV
jgi:glutathione S-transferase